jgi:hypothetical protein
MVNRIKGNTEMERKFFCNYLGGREYTFAEAKAESGELALQIHDLCCWPIEAGKLRKEKNALDHGIVTHMVTLLSEQMQECGKYTKEECAANWNWFTSKNIEGKDNLPLLKAFRESLKNREIQPCI